MDEASYPSLIRSRAGQVTAVDFWATWCAPCRKEMPWLAGLAGRFRAKGLVLITVSADEPEQETEAARFLQQAKVPEPYYVKHAKDDDAFIRAVDPKWSGALPALVLYGRSGKRVRSFIGEADPKAVEAALSKLLP